MWYIYRFFNFDKFYFTRIGKKHWIGIQQANVVTPLLLVATLPVLQIAKFLCVLVGHSGYSPKYLKRVYDHKFQRLGQCTDLAIKLFKKKKKKKRYNHPVLSFETAILSQISPQYMRFQRTEYFNIFIAFNKPLNSIVKSQCLQNILNRRNIKFQPILIIFLEMGRVITVVTIIFRTL